MIIRYVNAKIVSEDKIVSGDLWCAEGKIIAPKSSSDVEVDLKGALMAPGYIDLQINGLHGLDFTSNLESISKAADILPNYGVTAFLPTIISSRPDQYRKILPTISYKSQTAAILGLHLEGPFFHPLFCGAHLEKYLKKFEGEDPLIECYGSLENVKMVTLAPELPGALYSIQTLQKRGIIVAAGHSHCSTEAFQTIGINMVTHLFNGMGPFHHRAPGIVGAVLGGESCFYSIIADEVHVDPIAVCMSWRANSEGLILVSDASPAVGMKEGAETRFGDSRIRVVEGQPYLIGTNTLAGTTLTLDEAVRRFHRMVGCSIPEAIAAASSKPAKLLGLSKGSLEIGFDADFILLDEKLQIKSVFIAAIQVKNH